MDYKNLLELVKARRSIHRFKPEPVPDEYINKIIEVARWAPSGYNSQPWEFMVIKKREIKDKIIELIFEDLSKMPRMEATREPETKEPMPKLEGPPPEINPAAGMREAPVFIILCGDTRTKMGLPIAARYDRDMSQHAFSSSLANAFLYMHLAATSLGLASQWMSGIRIPLVKCLVKDILEIPPELEIFEMMVLGYPALKPIPKLLKPVEKMVHWDRCGKDGIRTDEEVNDTIRKIRAWNFGAIIQEPD